MRLFNNRATILVFILESITNGPCKWTQRWVFPVMAKKMQVNAGGKWPNNFWIFLFSQMRWPNNCWALAKQTKQRHHAITLPGGAHAAESIAEEAGVGCPCRALTCAALAALHGDWPGKVGVWVRALQTPFTVLLYSATIGDALRRYRTGLETHYDDVCRRAEYCSELCQLCVD